MTRCDWLWLLLQQSQHWVCTYWGCHWTRSSQASPSCEHQIWPSSPRACSYKRFKWNALNWLLELEVAIVVSAKQCNNRADRPPRNFASLHSGWIKGIRIMRSLSFPSLPHQTQPIGHHRSEFSTTAAAGSTMSSISFSLNLHISELSSYHHLLHVHWIL